MVEMLAENLEKQSKKVYVVDAPEMLQREY